MTIELTPEQEQVIDRAIQAGVIRTADDVVDVGVETIRRRLVEQVHALAEDAIKQEEADSMGRPLEERPAQVDSMSAQQWLQEFRAWVHSHATTTPLLSDEAINRESIYGTRGQ